MTLHSMIVLAALEELRLASATEIVSHIRADDDLDSLTIPKVLKALRALRRLGKVGKRYSTFHVIGYRRVQVDVVVENEHLDSLSQ